MMNTPIRAPEYPVDAEQRFTIGPRARPAYFNVIRAADLLDPATDRRARVAITRDAEAAAGPTIAFALEYPLRGGRIEERVILSETADGLQVVELERSVLDRADRRVRHERVDFADRTIPLPPSTYPEVLLPFLLGWTPFDGKTRSIFAWITDRFIARVRYRSTGRQTIELASGKVEAVEVVMFPDFNDWVRLGSWLSRLVSPFIPKYRMWYRPEPPHALVKFEGSYGPPGAPEISLELDAG
jgi:hypothetical protein